MHWVEPKAASTALHWAGLWAKWTVAKKGSKLAASTVECLAESSAEPSAELMALRWVAHLVVRTAAQRAVPRALCSAGKKAVRKVRYWVEN